MIHAEFEHESGTRAAWKQAWKRHESGTRAAREWHESERDSEHESGMEAAWKQF